MPTNPSPNPSSSNPNPGETAYAVCIGDTAAYIVAVANSGKYNEAGALRVARFARDTGAPILVYDVKTPSAALAAASSDDVDSVAIVHPAVTRAPARWEAGEDSGESAPSAAKNPREAARLTNRAALKAALSAAGLITAKSSALAEARAQAARAAAKLEAARAALLAAGLTEAEVAKILG